MNQFVIGYATGIQWSDGDMDVFSAQMAEVKSWYTENQAENLRITEFDDPRPATELGFGCQAGNNSITVAVDGEVSPCSKVLALDSKNLVLKLGDVTHGLTHLANRADICGAAELRKAWAQSFADQEYLGGCWATNVTDEGDPFVPSTQDQVFKGKQAAACAGCSSCK